MNIQRLIGVIGLILCTYTSWSQSAYEVKRGDYYLEQSLTVMPNQAYVLDVNFEFTAFSLSFSNDTFPVGTSIQVDSEEYILSKDEHAPEARNQANLVSLNSPAKRLVLNSGPYQGEVIIYLLNSYRHFKTDVRSRLDMDGDEPCAEPESVDQSEWRSGLQAPNFSRSFSDVEHVIIHHSAGSNTSTNYIQVVRDIYLYHTEVNGWSDIGYNYLIDKEGTIYKGRDPDDGDQDNVIGAHFCGKNSGTMGICLLGNFEEGNITPSEEAIESLIKLTSWKLIKESLDPFSSSIHRGEQLNTLAGHRDGCSTLCPGTNTYVQLESFKEMIGETIFDCENIEEESVVLTSNVYPNPARLGELVTVELNEDQTLKSIAIIDPNGKHIQTKSIRGSNNLTYLLTFLYPPGTYFLAITTETDQIKYSKLILY
ncbi:N-acetylmuramoyl-L-alanine amidase [Fulvivirga lutimaris]|uniref:N-acetylmuramoyl-L-alanine amidase n=1 Tax=Fulvivirga lutimaris TaxID=1819566 RepID=UPI0012BD4224|nr:N-acetylmuramoyl-L-alanine amidase [Fulvivirga lutimaris]MTI41699.1 T9SS type A sorting domain-containing protein [Fulvivirga lutimaris]